MRRGYSLLEVVVTMAIFGVFLLIITTLTLEMRTNEKRHPVNFMQHPQIVSLLSRLRRDVLDAYGGDPYRNKSPDGKYTMSDKVLIFETLVSGGGSQTVVWDFSTAGEVHRVSYNVGISTEWVARGLPPDFVAKIDAIEVPGHPYGVRITAVDKKGNLAIDQYLQPRAHN
ncbi:MAG TPA: type II secretion system protein [Thermoanaerobaculia bacterium]|nr:type II secretion system protein [Thermoanaerobaculia bacterium]